MLFEMWESSSQVIFLALSTVDCKFCAAGMWLFYFKMAPSDSSGSSPSFDWELAVSSAEEGPLSSPLYLVCSLKSQGYRSWLLALGGPTSLCTSMKACKIPSLSLSLWDSPPSNWALDGALAREFKKEYPQSQDPDLAGSGFHTYCGFWSRLQ